MAEEDECGSERSGAYSVGIRRGHRGRNNARRLRSDKCGERSSNERRSVSAGVGSGETMSTHGLLGSGVVECNWGVGQRCCDRCDVVGSVREGVWLVGGENGGDEE